MAKRAFLFVALAALVWAFTQGADFTEIATGVAIFLFGMTALEEGYQALTGGALERVLRAAIHRYARRRAAADQGTRPSGSL